MPASDQRLRQDGQVHAEPNRQPKQQMMTTLRTWLSMGIWPFLLRFAAIGAVAGLAAWSVVLLGHLVFDISKPTPLALLLAVPRGALFAVILALILRVYLNRSHRHDH